MDSTSNGEASEVTDQSTLDQALSQEPNQPEQKPEETSKELEPKKKYFGRFETVDEAETSYKEMQTAYQKMKEETKGMKEELSEKEKKQLDTMDYDEKTQFLVDKITELEAAIAKKEPEAVVDSSDQETKALNEYVEGNEVLKNSGMADLFLDLAGTEKYKEYTLDSIYNKLFKPQIEGLMGKKITVKEKPVVGESQAVKRDKELPSQGDWNNDPKARAAYLKAAGIKV